ncbi:MAG: SPOR domain-containing protein [Bacteroidota bacterium]
MKRHFTLFFLCLFCLVGVTAQALYTVQVGTFIDVRNADFNEIKPLGFVYGTPLEGNLTQVFLGNYSELAKAETVAGQLRVRGFKNAMVLQRPTQTGQNVVSIQLALTTNGKRIDWASLERVGTLYVNNDDQVIKILTGLYPSIAAAQQDLGRICQAGYRDAFIKTINNGRLISVGTFETGIKKALIPITLNNNQPPVAQTQPPVTTYGSGGVITPTPASNPAVVSPTPYNPGGAVTAKGGAISAADLPNIRGRFKRGSAQKLQLVLKEKGYYQGQIDGYYGNGTQQAYAAAWNDMAGMRKYQLLSQNATPLANDGPANWPEVKVLTTIAHEMSGGLGDQDLAAQSLTTRQSLYRTTQGLSVAAATRARAWELTLLENVDKWAIEDPLHAQIVSAFRVAYFQSQVRLEDYYMDKGLASDVAKDLAVATLQAFVGADLERFL